MNDSVMLASPHDRFGRCTAVVSVALMWLLIVASAAYASPDGGDTGGGQAIVESMPDFLPEVAFAVFSTVAMFVIYVRSRVQRIRKMHDPQ